MSKTAIDNQGKPIPPRKDWPLTANGNGQWSKKTGGKVYYFGTWEDWRQAERNYSRRWPAILAGLPDPGNEGQSQPAEPGACTFDVAVNAYVAAKKVERERGDISIMHYAAIRREGTFLLDVGGFRHKVVKSTKPADWAKFRQLIEDRYGPDTRKRMIGVYRAVSAFCAKNGICPAFDFGDELSLPEVSELRAARRQQDREHGEKLFPPEQIKPILDACDMPLDAMFLLSLNAGFTAADLGNMTVDSLRLDEHYFDYDRHKTGVQRAGFLWPETVIAIRNAIAHRPPVNKSKFADAMKTWEASKPKDGKEALRKWELRKPQWDRLVFLTRFGMPWWREIATKDADGRDNASKIDAIGMEFGKLLTRLDKKYPKGVGGMKFKRGRIRFGTGRHTFYTAAKRCDAEAAQFIQGHADSSMGAWYDHLDDGKLERLQAVSDSVYASLIQAKSVGALRFRPFRLAGTAV